VIAGTRLGGGLAAEVARLRRGMRDLIGLLTMSVAPIGTDAGAIAGSSLDILVASMRLDVGLLQLRGRPGAPRTTVIRVPTGRDGRAPSGRLEKAIQDWLAATPEREQERVPSPDGRGLLSLARVRLGLHNDLGVLVAGSRRQDFPTEVERLLLSVASNQAASRLQEARRWSRSVRERALRARFEAMLDERGRLAREIHDTLLQGFTGLSLQLAALAATVREPETAAALNDLVGRAQRTLTDARRAVWGLRVPAVTDGDLDATLRQVAEDALAGAGVTLIYDVRGDARPLSPETVAAVVRVAQEALANVVSHARAHRVRLQLTLGARSLRLKIEDDGDGFVVDPDFRAYGGHWGLIGMHERAAQARGAIEVHSAPGAGTLVTLRLPYLAPSPKG
jgi:signal transduction histidine kinase